MGNPPFYVKGRDEFDLSTTLHDDTSVEKQDKSAESVRWSSRHPRRPEFTGNFTVSHKKRDLHRCKSLNLLVGRDGFEPSTNRLKVYCSTN